MNSKRIFVCDICKKAYAFDGDRFKHLCPMIPMPDIRIAAKDEALLPPETPFSCIELEPVNPTPIPND